MAAHVLEKLGAELGQVRLAVVQTLTGYMAEPSSKPEEAGPVMHSASDYHFTERSLRAISFAKSEALRRGKQSIDVQDILVALTREENAISKLLAEKGLTAESVRELLKEEDPVDEVVDGTVSAEEIQDEVKDESPPEEGESSAG